MHNDFNIDIVLKKPCMAHLATSCKDGPRNSPVWFLYEEKVIWIFGTNKDSFIERLKADPRCALTVVDFNLEKGILLHVGMRGCVKLTKVDTKRLQQFKEKYLGYDSSYWNTWFLSNVVTPLSVMVSLHPETVVAKNVSYFKTGPDLAAVPE